MNIFVPYYPVYNINSIGTRVGMKMEYVLLFILSEDLAPHCRPWVQDDWPFDLVMDNLVGRGVEREEPSALPWVIGGG